jgi:2,4-dienoyl-CoA reductase-like NADH-dependent reductase (Old Yellow Enzyme family)
MHDLFETTTINKMKLANRFVRSATWEGLADEEGGVTGRLIHAMVELARNEVALIITGHAFVSPEGRAGRLQMAAYDDKFLPGLGDMAKAVHAAGGKITLQLAHGGRFSTPAPTGGMPVGPSDEEAEGKRVCRSLTAEEISSVVGSFAAAARRAQRAGFDAVQLHAAHGYLLSQFLSPAFNRRTDGYGGTLDHRARLLLEVVRAVRGTVGPDYPILVKLNAEDFLEGGLAKEEALRVAKMLEEASVDAIEFSGGTGRSGNLMPPRPGALKTREEEVYYRESARLYKQQVGIPLILVGGIRSLETAEELVGSGVADYIALSRPLVSEPDLVERWREGERSKARCVSCNGCFGPAFDGRGAYCTAFEGK